MTEQAMNLFEDAYANFLRMEKENILSNVSERNLCARLGMAINDVREKHGYADYFIDAEYNRKQNGQIKTIINDDFKVLSITCDLIVHSRGRHILHDNILAIEMKKANRPEMEKNNDKNRLIALTKNSFDDVWSADGDTHPEHVCGYDLGIFIELNIEQARYSLDFFRNGQYALHKSGEF